MILQVVVMSASCEGGVASGGCKPLYWVFPKIGVPQNEWFMMENPIKMDDLGVKPTIFGNIHIHSQGCNPKLEFLGGGASSPIQVITTKKQKTQRG